ncbi:MAG: cell division protein FtsA [Chloroflexi bacterium]|nr:cell division protein FtsA [Chloroflexota bacterium]
MTTHEDSLLVALDVGTAKVAALAAEPHPTKGLQVVAAALERSRGMRKGAVVNMSEVSRVLRRVAERTARIAQRPVEGVYVTFAGSAVHSQNNRAAVGVSRGVVEEDDIQRAEDSARAVTVAHNQEVVHVIRRGFRLDDKEVPWPLGMYGYRLEAEVHIVTAEKTALLNLRRAVEEAGLSVEGFVLGGLAAGEAVLSQAERDMGVLVVDIGAGTTDVALYANGEVWHTAVIPLGGDHITRDLAYGLNVPLEVAEQIKVEYGRALPARDAAAEEPLNIRPFGAEADLQVRPSDLALIIGPRVEEILSQVARQVERHAPPGMLAAGVVLTGGTAHLPGVRPLAARVLRMPARIGRPEVLPGLPRRFQDPAFAATVGALKLAHLYRQSVDGPEGGIWSPRATWWERLWTFLRGLLP